MSLNSRIVSPIVNLIATMPYLPPLLVFLMLSAGCAQKGVQPDLPEQAQLSELELKQQEAAKRFQAALALQQDGQLAQAEAAYKVLAEDYPAHTAPLVNLAILAIKAGDEEQARGYLEQALNIKPQHLHALNLMGVLEREAGAFDESEGYYRKALTANPDFQPALRNMAILLDIYLGRLSEALPLYEHYQSLQTTPDPQVKDWIFDLKSRLGAS